MCLDLKKFGHRNNEPKVAKKDIVCYKMFKLTENGLESPFRHTKWNKDKIKNCCITADCFQTTPHISPDGSRYITNGLHCYRHSPYSDDPYKTFQYRLLYPDCIVVMCVIPSGSRYWIGRDDDYCSEKLYLMY
jgi:hypothetical protein